MRLQLILSLLFLGVFHQIYSQSSYQLSNVPKELLVNANSVVLDENVEIDVTKLGKQTRKLHRVQLVLNKYGNNDISAFEKYDLDTKINKIEAYVYDASGNELEHFKKRDFKDVSAVDNISVFTDDRALYLNYTPTVYPYIIEFNSEIQNNTTVFIEDWDPIKGYSESTVKSTYSLIYNPTNKPRTKTINFDGYPISVSENPNTIVCEANNLKAIKYEEFGPQYHKIFPSASFVLNKFSLKGVQGYAENWQQFGSWMQSTLLNDVRELPPSTIMEVKNLVHNATTNIEKTRLIYKYLQEKVRYISVQIDIGGWKPMLASEVDKLSYGDCKALANYTKALLDVLEIPSYYTLLYSDKSEYDFSEEYFGMQGNHVILGVPDGDEIVWLECTSQETPFGYVGNSNDNRDVLMITPEGGEIVHTKAYDYKSNTLETNAKITVDTTGGVETSHTSVYEGIFYDDKYFIDRKSEDDLKEYYLNKWSYINGYHIDSIEIEDNKGEISFTENLDIDIPSYCSSIGDDLLFCPNIFNQFHLIPPRINKRLQDVYIPTGYTSKSNVEITVPENFSIDQLPEEKVIESQFGSYSISFQSLSENKLTYQRKFIVKQGAFPPQEYKNFRNFLKKISKLDKTKILLTKN